MLKKYVIGLLVVVLVLLGGCSESKAVDDNLDDKIIKVGVSIVPQETFVKAVGGDKVSVVTMIPPGTSPANYGPTPKEMASLEDADLYFAIGVNAEIENILPTVEENESIKVIHLSDEIENVYPARFFGESSHEEDEHEEDEHNHDGRDPHIWMSPKRVIEMIKVIERELALNDPDNEEFYEKNMNEYIKKLEEVDLNVKDMVAKSENKTFIIYHPSLGYFSDDYGLKMVSIENDGKEGTIDDLKEVVDLSKAEKIKKVIYQSEFDSKQAEILAGEIDGEAVMIAPLSSDYIDNLKKIAEVVINVGY